MLKSIGFKNFKSYDQAELPLAGLTVLLGANASGKSNAIEALRLLAWLAEGRRLDYLLQAMRDREVDLRGSPLELSHAGSPIGLSCVLVDDVGEELTLSLSLRVAEDGVRIIEEQLSSNRETVSLYEVVQPASAFSNQISVSYNNFARGPYKPQIVAIDQQAVFTQLTTPARFDAKDARSQEYIPNIVAEVQSFTGMAPTCPPSFATCAMVRAARATSSTSSGRSLNRTSRISASWMHPMAT